MKRVSMFLALFAALTFSVAGAAAAPAPTVVYNAIPSALPPNMASLGFQANQTSEFGDYVHLAGTDRTLKTVTVTMSDWALSATYPSLPAAGWTHPITLNVYGAVPGTPLNAVGPLLGTVTQTVTIPWRPAEDPVNCPTKSSAGYAYKWQAVPGAPDTNCYNGFAFNVTFDLSSLNLTLPSDVILGVAYSTQSYGAAPLGVDGPYNSLNVGVEGAATVGTDDNIDRVFWNTATAAWYTDGGAAGVGIFREDTNWGVPAVSIPEGTIPFQITATSLLVGPPTSKDQCKKDGWKAFNNPSFKNQGACEKFVSDKGGHGDEGGHGDKGGHGDNGGRGDNGDRGDRHDKGSKGR